jgi:hypothetical protein
VENFLSTLVELSLGRKVLDERKLEKSCCERFDEA